MSSTAMGDTGRFVKDGNGTMGNRSAMYRSTSNEVEPDAENDRRSQPHGVADRVVQLVGKHLAAGQMLGQVLLENETGELDRATNPASGDPRGRCWTDSSHRGAATVFRDDGPGLSSTGQRCEAGGGGGAGGGGLWIQQCGSTPRPPERRAPPPRPTPRPS